MSPQPLHLDLPADAESLAVVRERVASWLMSLGAPADQVGDIVLVVNEACSNSIEHAYIGGGARTIRISADIESQFICIAIEDFGKWKTDTSKTDASRGRGLALMRAMSARVGLHTSTGGTRVSLSFPSPTARGDTV